MYILVRIHNFSDSFLANLALTAGILIHIVGWLVVYGLVMKYFDFTVFLNKELSFYFSILISHSCFFQVTDEKYGEMSGATKVILAIIYPNIGLQWGIEKHLFS